MHHRAGWSGLLACKYALQYGLRAVVLEQRASLGGVWNFTEDPEIVTVMASTITSTSATVTEASDFPMDLELGNFIHLWLMDREKRDQAVAQIWRRQHWMWHLFPAFD